MSSTQTDQAQIKRDNAIAKLCDMAAQLLEACKPLVEAAVKETMAKRR